MAVHSSILFFFNFFFFYLWWILSYIEMKQPWVYSLQYSCLENPMDREA